MATGTFVLRIELGNDAMQTLDDIARALERTAEHLHVTYATQGRIYDENGNGVGSYEVQ